MVVIGRYSYEEIKDRLEKCEELVSDLVVSGKCYKELIYQDSMGSEELLWLSPLAVIGVHQHAQDSELYFDWYNNNVEYCEKELKHGLENISDEKWALVVSIKRND